MKKERMEMKKEKNRVWLFELPKYLWLTKNRPRYLVYNEEGTIYECFEWRSDARNWIERKGLLLEEGKWNY